MKEGVKPRRPIGASIVSLAALSMGVIGFVGAIIVCLALSARPDIFPLSLRASVGFIVVLWLVVGPTFVLAGYNLWKLKKWAAQVVAGIMLLDLASAVSVTLLSRLAGVHVEFLLHLEATSIEDILAWALNVACLALLAFDWKRLLPGSGASLRFT